MAPLVAATLTPRELLASRWDGESLESLFPATFGNWRLDTSLVPLAPNPALESELAQVYTATLARTYVSSTGQRIMLSVAYGKDQRGEGRAHYPEVCYPAQGFQIRSQFRSTVDVAGRQIPGVRLVAQNGSRLEPITYWVTVGDEIVNSGLAHKRAIISYGMKGQIADGLLVRISSISPDINEAYLVHERFVSDLYGSLDQRRRERLLGHFSRMSAPPVDS